MLPSGDHVCCNLTFDVGWVEECFVAACSNTELLRIYHRIGLFATVIIGSTIPELDFVIEISDKETLVEKLS